MAEAQPLLCSPFQGTAAGFGVLPEKQGFFTASVLTKAPRHPPHTNSSGASSTADPGAEARGSSSLHNLKNLPSCISPNTSLYGI